MDKEQYDIVKGAMDVHAEQISIVFADWIYKGYVQCDITDQWKESRRCSHGRYTSQQLFQQFKQEICKNVNQDVSANSIQKQENR